MLNSTSRAANAVLKGVTVAALLSGGLATNASAEDAKIKSASFSIQAVYKGDEIVVTSSDGKKWDKIDAKALKLSATMHVDTKHPGYVSQVGILLGGCHNTGCANNPVMYYAGVSSRDYHSNKVIDFPGNKIPVSTTGIAVPSFGNEILNACNNGLQADGATKSRSFNKLLTASFSANTRKALGTLPPAEVNQPETGYPDYNGGDVTRQANFTVKITCKAYVPPPLELKTATFMAYTHGPAGCPKKAIVEAQFYTNRAGKIDFVLYRGDGASQKHSVQTTKKDSGKYHVYWHKDYTFAKSVNRKYKIVVVGHNYSSPWKSLVVKCGAKNDSDGPKGVTTGPKPQTNGKPNKRPTVIVTPKPPKVPGIKVAPVKKITCIGGKISKRRCFCPARTKKITIGKKAYRCVLNVKKKTPKVKLKRPLRVKKVVCIGGKTSKNRCFCPARTKKTTIGKNAYRCVINKLKLKRVAPKVRKKRRLPVK